MGRFETMNIHWPPIGWRPFAGVKASSGQSIAKDIFRARIFGLQYSIESVPLFKMETRLFRHDIMVGGWEYSILNDSREYPVLSFSLYDRFDDELDKECFVSDIRSYDTPIAHTRRSVNRAVSAALFMIRQVSEGNVPDVNRVLRAYKLHPNQAFIYRDDRSLEPDLCRSFGSVQTRRQLLP